MQQSEGPGLQWGQKGAERVPTTSSSRSWKPPHPPSFTGPFSAGGIGSQLLCINFNSLTSLENCVHRSPAGTEVERSKERDLEQRKRDSCGLF